MASPRASRASRASDIKLIVGATVAVVFVGLFIAGALLVTTSGGGNPVCGQQQLSATDVRKTLQSGGPYFTTGGGRCSFWLALDDNDIVAYKAEQPGPPECTLKLKRDHWECGGQVVDAASLAQYPVSIQRIGNIDTLVIQLGTPPGSTAPATTTG